MRTHPIRATACALLMLGALSAASTTVATVAAADPAKQADEHFQRGKALYTQGKKREAYEALLAAWALKKSYDIAANLGTAELAMGKPRDAAEHYAYCIRRFPPTGSKKQLAAVQKIFDETRQKLGALAIKVNVQGAEVFLDGRSMGLSPLEAEVLAEPGAHVVEAKLAEHETASVSVQVAKGPAQDLELALVPSRRQEVAVMPAPPAAPPPVQAQPVAPPAPEPVASGLVAVEPMAPQVQPALARRPMWPMAVGGGLAVVGLAMGAGFTVAANGKASQVAQLQSGHSSSCSISAASGTSRCTTLHDAASSRVTLSNAAASSFILGTGFALATAGLAIWARLTPTAAPVRVAPTVGATHFGAAIQGAW